MKVLEAKGLLTHRYSNLTEFAEYQIANPGYKMSRRDERANRAFSGVTSMAEAAERAKRGLPEVGVKVLRGAGKLTASSVRQVNKVDVLSNYDVSGSYVDMGRFMEGTPECMVEYSFDTTPVINPVITIASNVNASGGISKDKLIARGKLVVALIKAIETSGRSTELWVDCTNSAHGMHEEHHYRISVQIKRAASPLNMGSVMYAFTDPSMLRALMFNAMHALPENLQGHYGVGAGYGCVPPGSIRVEESYGSGCVYLPAVRLGGDDAEATVTKVLTRLGIA